MEIVIVQQRKELPRGLQEVIKEESYAIRWYKQPKDVLRACKKQQPPHTPLPRVICWNAIDFPTEWQLLMGYLMGGATPIHMALITKETLSFDEGSESIVLGVKQVIPESLEYEEQKELWHQFLEKTSLHIQKGRAPIEPEQEPVVEESLMPWTKRIGKPLTLRHPESEERILGEIETVTNQGIVFYPEHPLQTIEIEEGTILEGVFQDISYETRKDKVVHIWGKVVENNLLITLLPVRKPRRNQ